MIFAQSAWLGLYLADWIILGIYFAVILGIGIWSITKVNDMADFFMGGRRFGKVFMMFFAFGTGTSSDQAITVVAGTWRTGLSGIWWQFLWLWATPFYWIVAPIMRRMRALTTADFFESRYGPSTALLYSIYGIIMAITFIASGLFGSGKMVNALTGGELDRVAENLDISVPKLAWMPDERRVGGGVLFDAKPEDVVDSLDDQQVSAELKRRFAKAKRRMSDRVTIAVVEPGQHWIINDEARNETFEVRRRQVEQKIQPELDDDQNADLGTEKVDRIRFYGSGWRLLEGYELAILAMTIMFVSYGMAGGLGAAIITDLIQGVLTIGFSFLLLPFIFYMIGGFGALNENAGMKEGMLDMVASENVAKMLGREQITIFYVCMLSLTGLAGIVVQPHIMGVCGAGKTEFEGRFGFTVGNFLKRFCTIAWTFTGLAAIVWYLGTQSPLLHEHDSPVKRPATAEEIVDDQTLHADLNRYATMQKQDSDESEQTPRLEKDRLKELDSDFADELFGRAAYDILPTIAPGLIGLLLASLLAAIMSTADAQMVVGSGLFTENIYRRYLGRGRSQRHYLWVGRIAGLLIVAAALVIQSTFTDVIDALQVVIKIPAAIGISLWFGIVWRRWNTTAVWISTFVATIAWAAVAYFPIDLASWGLPEFFFNKNDAGRVEAVKDAWQMFAFLSVGVVTGILVSLLTKPEAKPKLDHFYTLLHTPVTPGEEPPGPCQLPENPAPRTRKMFPNSETIELQRPTLIGIGGFILSWIGVALVIGLTYWLAAYA